MAKVNKAKSTTTSRGRGKGRKAAKKARPADNQPKSEVLTALEREWEKLRGLIPCITDESRVVEGVGSDIYKLVDGKKTCEDIVNAQDLAVDTAVVIFHGLERDGTIHCVEISEKLRDVNFEKSEVEKELLFLEMEKERLLERTVQLNGELLNVQIQNKGDKQEISSTDEKIALSKENIGRLQKKHKGVSSSVDRLVSRKMDMLRQEKKISKYSRVLKEEIVFLKDEKLSAMESVRELESKIENVLQARDSLNPKMSAYRAVLRESFKTLRTARDRANAALKAAE